MPAAGPGTSTWPAGTLGSDPTGLVDPQVESSSARRAVASFTVRPARSGTTTSRARRATRIETAKKTNVGGRPAHRRAPAVCRRSRHVWSSAIGPRMYHRRADGSNRRRTHRGEERVQPVVARAASQPPLDVEQIVKAGDATGRPAGRAQMTGARLRTTAPRLRSPPARWSRSRRRGAARAHAARPRRSSRARCACREPRQSSSVRAAT